MAPTASQTYPACVDLWSNQPTFIVLLGLSGSCMCMKCVESWMSWTRCSSCSWFSTLGHPCGTGAAKHGEKYLELWRRLGTCWPRMTLHPTERSYESWCYHIIHNISRMIGWYVKISHATYRMVPNLWNPWSFYRPPQRFKAQAEWRTQQLQMLRIQRIPLTAAMSHWRLKPPGLLRSPVAGSSSGGWRIA